MFIKVIKIILVLFLICFSNNLTVYGEYKNPLNFQGELLEWKEVDKIIPNKSIFQVIDLETGLSFNVQRRAGSRHADVQPLTDKDTKTMKEIYGGSWSWHRRAILVIVDNHFIAASMHGMPHGIGVLKNNFPGHFCIHFYKSTTHTTKEVDLAHQLMIFKGAGVVNEYIQNLSLTEIIDILFVAINQDDPMLLQLVITEPDKAKELLQDYKGIYSIKRISSLDDDKDNGLLISNKKIRVLIYKTNQSEVKKNLSFILIRSTVSEQWKIMINK